MWHLLMLDSRAALAVVYNDQRVRIDGAPMEQAPFVL
jgi:hypothetical protein